MPTDAQAEGLAPDQEIPDRLYFRIGDVSKIAGVKPYVLRYWETEFPAIAPKKSGTGQRLYRRKDVELILHIKHLLYEKRFTIEGARKAIDSQGKTPGPKHVQSASQHDLFAPPGVDNTRIREALSPIRSELEAILKLLQ